MDFVSTLNTNHGSSVSSIDNTADTLGVIIDSSSNGVEVDVDSLIGDCDHHSNYHNSNAGGSPSPGGSSVTSSEASSSTSQNGVQQNGGQHVQQQLEQQQQQQQQQLSSALLDVCSEADRLQVNMDNWDQDV